MHELTRIILENEMDLILAHRRSMKLGEMSGLSLSAQTTFATAVSEVARMSLDAKKKSSLILRIQQHKKERYIVASMTIHATDLFKHANNGFEFAKKLVAKHSVSIEDNATLIELFYFIAPSFRIDIELLDKWRSYFRNEPPISPYEELKRKNEQLLELSEKIKKSEAEYVNLTNTLPLFIFSMDGTGHLLYVNKWLTDYTGQSREQLNSNMWSEIVHPDDYDSFSLFLNRNLTSNQENFTIQTRIKHAKQNKFRWHQMSLSAFANDDQQVQYWTGYIADIHAQKEYEQTLQDNAVLKDAQEQLRQYQRKLEDNITELNRSNFELQQFAFIASHDLQEPLRKIMFSSDYLLERYKKSFDKKAGRLLQSLYDSSNRMRMLVHDVLSFSQLDKNLAQFVPVELNKVSNEMLQDLELSIAEKKAVIIVGDLPVVEGNPSMMRQLFDNIVGNALKYSKKDTPVKIKLYAVRNLRTVTIVFHDNGIGFDEKHLDKVFNLFQRLHRLQEYEGTGIGLAICRKIVEIHKGQIWAQSKVNEGSSFYVELPVYNAD